MIVGNGINEIDVGGEEVLVQLFKKLRYEGYGVHVSGANDVLRDVIRRSDLSEVIDDDNLFPNARTAIRTIRERAKNDPEAEPLCDPATCPLSKVVVDPGKKSSMITEAVNMAEK